MNLTNPLKRMGITGSILFALLPTKGLADPATQVFETTVTIAIPVPTCSVSAPATVDLGTLTPGMKINWLPDVSISVNCDGQPIKHAVYMQSQNKQTSNHDGIFLRQSSDHADTDILLHLRGSNGSDKFTTDEQNPVAVHEGTGTSTYQTKVLVEVPNNAKAGEVSGIVTFKLTYPA
ncbi:fimbrial protein [Salmonella enterica subsp. enterica serovar Braenderup]|nr:fimbrial protein [Salmonella enterica subsp. enterica serovar Braenderup]EHM7742178.1 fimbrial protein [Salmonella enterica subsp. enterica serovar Braenderup]HCM3552947.1 fimbrial protein [Salmonella enterica subsp. enterica serovar Minnesota]